MAQTFRELDRHFQLPEIRSVDTFRPFAWLGMALDDIKRSPAVSLGYGLAFAAAGWLILNFAADRPYLFSAAISGFMLIAPLLAAGLYELSRRHMRNEPAGWTASFQGWTRNGQSMFHLGVVLAVIAIGWERLSAILFALFYRGDAPDLANFFSSVLFSGEYVHFVVAYFVVGGALAALVFALTAVSVPMLMDREVDIATAAMTSARAIGANLGAMALWALLIVSLVVLGFATALLGMIFIMPLLGHATWHAYRDIVR